jgi:hypothetical protein
LVACGDMGMASNTAAQNASTPVMVGQFPTIIATPVRSDIGPPLTTLPLQATTTPLPAGLEADIVVAGARSWTSWKPRPSPAGPACVKR